MAENMKLKVMALGNIKTIKRLYASMDNDGIDLVGISGVSEAFARLEQENFDVILIDSLIEEVGVACRYICKLACAPIALLFREREANWQKLCMLEVDGFVPEDSGKKELVSRIKAISRRNIQATASQPDQHL
jgi:DNA-binding response OmpR family regulator